MSKHKLIVCVLLFAAAMLLGACSPEATRTRSGGPGADIGNRGSVVDMHGSSNPAYQEPQPGRAIQVQKAGGQ